MVKNKFSIFNTTVLVVSILLVLRCEGQKDHNGGVQETGTPSLAAPNGSMSLTDVDDDNLIQLLQDMSGVSTVTVNGSQYVIDQRYTPEAKANYRAYWLQYFASLNIPTSVLPYKTAFRIGETQGHNMEAVLEGKSKDTIIVISHYDSMGPTGDETSNPAADDDMSGMSTMLETARVLSIYKDSLQYTVRFVATDYEEESNPDLEGARVYAQYIDNLAKKEHFKIIASIGMDQTGWDCLLHDACQDSTTQDTLDVFSCSDDDNNFDSQGFGDMFTKFVSQYSALEVERSCTIDDSDAYVFWEIGVPTFTYVEHNPDLNTHFDDNGNDTFAHIDQEYFLKISQVSTAFVARLAGVGVKK